MSYFISIRLIFTWLGINMTDSLPSTSCEKILYLLRNICFPLIMHLNIIISQYMKPNGINFENLFNYANILDLLMVVFPCALWWSVFNRKGSVIHMVNQLSKFKRSYRDSKVSSTTIIYCSIAYWIAMIFFMLFTAICRPISIAKKNAVFNDTLTNGTNDSSTMCDNAQHGSLRCNWGNFFSEFTLFTQELFFPFIFSLLYLAICIRLVKSLKCCKARLKQLKDNNGEYILHLELEEYLGVVKCAECFAARFSTPLFLFSCQIFCYLTLSFLDIFLIKDFDHFIAAHIFVVTISLLALTAILTFCAAEIPLKIAAIKRVLNDIKTEQLLKNIQTNNEAIDAVLSRETLTITACHLASFDRSFLLKAITAIIAHAIIYYQFKESFDS